MIFLVSVEKYISEVILFFQNFLSNNKNLIRDKLKKNEVFKKNVFYPHEQNNIDVKFQINFLCETNIQFIWKYNNLILILN